MDLHLSGRGVGGGNRCLPLAAGAIHTCSRVVVPHACIRGGMWNYITHCLSICMDTCALPKLIPCTNHDYMQHGIMRDLWTGEGNHLQYTGTGIFAVRNEHALHLNCIMLGRPPKRMQIALVYGEC